jgi:hypothetical protein
VPLLVVIVVAGSALPFVLDDGSAEEEEEEEEGSLLPSLDANITTLDGCCFLFPRTADVPR